MKSTTATAQDNIDFDIAAAEAALHGRFVEDILAASNLNNARTCKCTSCDSWMPCNRGIPDFCTCPNCGAVH